MRIKLHTFFLLYVPYKNKGEIKMKFIKFIKEYNDRHLKLNDAQLEELINRNILKMTDEKDIILLTKMMGIGIAPVPVKNIAKDMNISPSRVYAKFHTSFIKLVHIGTEISIFHKLSNRALSVLHRYYYHKYGMKELNINMIVEDLNSGILSHAAHMGEKTYYEIVEYIKTISNKEVNVEYDFKKELKRFAGGIKNK